MAARNYRKFLGCAWLVFAGFFALLALAYLQFTHSSLYMRVLNTHATSNPEPEVISELYWKLAKLYWIEYVEVFAIIVIALGGCSLFAAFYLRNPPQGTKQNKTKADGVDA